VRSSVREADPGSDDKVFDGARDEHFSPLCGVGDASGDVHGESAEVAAPDLAFAAVESGTDLEPEGTHRLVDRYRATNRSRRAVEAGDETVTGRVDFSSPAAHELPSNDGVVAIEQLQPSLTPERGREFRAADNVGEHDRGQDAIRFRWCAHASEELLDLLQEGVGVLADHRWSEPGSST
jgi:hypothetical protein